MAIDINRRMAFQRAFMQYFPIMEQFVKGHVWLENPKDPNHPANKVELSQRQEGEAMQSMFAQFLVRLLKSRAKGGTPAMQWFAFETASRYINYKKAFFGDLELQASEKHLVAFNAVEGHMAQTILYALAAEANGPAPDFNETDFWVDVLQGLLGNQKRHQPNFTVTAQAILLDYMKEFAKALAEADAPANENAHV